MGAASTVPDSARVVAANSSFDSLSNCLCYGRVELRKPEGSTYVTISIGQLAAQPGSPGKEVVIVLQLCSRRFPVLDTSMLEEFEMPVVWKPFHGCKDLKA